MPNCDKGALGLGGYHSIKKGEHHLFPDCADGVCAGTEIRPDVWLADKAGTSGW